MASLPPSDAARERILHAAADLFVAHGLKATSVRKICEAAGVNVSMVNYYFHSKEQLYLAVLDQARRQEIREPSRIGASPEAQLRQRIETFLKNLLLPGPHALLTKLITRELIEPSAAAIDSIIANDIQPQHADFADLIQAIAGGGLSAREVRACIFSLIGQALFYANNRALNDRIAPDLAYDDTGIRHIADHVHRFTVAAIKGYRTAGAGSRP